jgi:signal transduction histidine kinase
LSRSLALGAARQPAVRRWAGAALALTLATTAALLLARLIMAPPAGDLVALAVYLAFSGIATLGGGWLALRAADRALGPSIQTKSFLSAMIGAVVALLNVLIVARLMFLSTAHDLRLLIVLLVFSAAVTVFFNRFVASSTAARLALVAGGINALASGDYRARVCIDGGDEVARLGDDLNHLAGRLRAMEEERHAIERDRRDLTAAVSHDLRTPLASVRAMVEALDDGVVDAPAEVARYHGAIRREIERLNRMIDDLFALARMDAGALKLTRRPVSLAEIAADVAEGMQGQARQNGVTLALDVAGPLPDLPLDGAWIERAVANLLRNALEHTPAGGRIAVAVCVKDGAALLRVTDTGEGIDPAELPRIWDRFYRVERSRRRGPGASDGAGLGLAIVRGIVEAHGGAARVDSAPRQGACFTLSFPITEDH